MAEKVFSSERYSWQWRDALNSLIYAGGFSAATALQQALDANAGIDWKVIAYAALGGVLSHLTRTFLSAPKVVTTYKTNAKAKAVATDINAKN